MLLICNAVYFFVFNPHKITPTDRAPLTQICDAADRSFQVRAGQTEWHLPQPVNVMLISDRDGTQLMMELGWIRNQTFSRDQIGFLRFISLIMDGTPPVSELYLDGAAADSAFQLPGNLQHREHIRWWSLGAGVHFGAISQDEELAIKYYGRLPVILHDINPATDASRDMLRDQISHSDSFNVVGLAALAPVVGQDDQWDYTSDGGVLIVTDRTEDVVPDDVMKCLKITSFRNLH